MAHMAFSRQLAAAGVLVAASLLLPACGEHASSDGSRSTKAAAPAALTAIELPDVDGGTHDVTAVPAGTVHVVVFTSHECPIANAYAPTLARIADDCAERPVRMFFVHVDPDLGAEPARAHRDEYELPGTVLLDPRHVLANALGATTTPEAVVLRAGADGAVVAYRGRIDDQWRGLGTRAPAASTHDLRDAIDAALRGEDVPEPHPAAVGCLLPEPAR